MSETPEWLLAITDADAKKRVSALLTLAASPQGTNVADQLAHILVSAGRLLQMLSAFESAKTAETGAKFVSYCLDVANCLPLANIVLENSVDWGEEYYPERGYCLWDGGWKGDEAMWLLESGHLLAIHFDSTRRYKNARVRPIEALILASQSERAIRVVRITANSLYDTYRHLARKNDPRRKEITRLLFGSTGQCNSSTRDNISSETIVSKTQRQQQSVLRREQQRAQVEQFRQQAAEEELRRDSERGAQRERLRLERQSLGLCIVCGKKLSVFDKMFGVPQHKACFS